MRVRLGLPSKGRMEKESLSFLSQCGFIVKRNGRDYIASMENVPEIQIVFQRQEDIVKGVENGMLTFGIAGYDLVSEIPLDPRKIVIIHPNLAFGQCSLEIAIPEDWSISSVKELDKNQVYRIASKFPKLTTDFFEQRGINFIIVDGAGTLEVSPALGNSDFIVDLVSSGRTLADNRLKRLSDGKILDSEAVFIGNRKGLLDQENLNRAKLLLEYFEATIRARRYVSVHVNMRGDPDEIIQQMFNNKDLNGLQGPTVSKIYGKNESKWFAIHIVVKKKILNRVIQALRTLGGSGVVVTQTSYIFEEEPVQFTELLRELEVS